MATSNYNWPTPVQTDLVKDGWEAIKDLGDAADTTVKAVSDAQGLVHIETQDFSAVSSFSFSNDVFTSAYENYKIVCYLSASANDVIVWRGRIAGVDTTDANYNSEFLTAGGSTVTGTRSTNQTSSRFGQVSSGTGGNSFTADIYAPYELQHTRLYSNGFASFSGALIEIGGTVYKSNTTQFDSLSIIVGSGTITGKAALYGYRD